MRRAQLWLLLSALPAVVRRYRDLVDAVLRADYEELWRALVAGEEREDRLAELEGWLEGSDEDGERRGKPGSKYHLLIDGGGLPLAVGLSAANTHDSWSSWSTPFRPCWVLRPLSTTSK